MSRPILVIPDLHQRVAWAKQVLDQELDLVEEVIFLGDYFDAKSPEDATAMETVRFLKDTEHTVGRQRLTLLVGNHDLPYLFDLHHPEMLPSSDRNPYRNSGYNPAISESIRSEWRFELEPFCLRHGHLLSHAGLAKRFLKNDTVKALEKLGSELKADLASLPITPPAVLAAVGHARGGGSDLGGVAWLDWRYEFEDELPWPQIVGHTKLSAPSKIGRSWNIDTAGNHYALLSKEGVKIKSVN